MSTIPRICVLALVAAVVGLGTVPEPLDGQMTRRIRERAQEEAERRAEQRADDAVDHALDRAEGAVVCVITDRDCIRTARDDGREVTYTDQDGTALAGPAAEGAAALRPGEGAWANYDFVPGERVIFAEDFGRDAVGDFPRRLELRRGNMEVVEWEGARYLRATATSDFAIPLAEELPARFTLEFDYALEAGWVSAVRFTEDPLNTRAEFIFHRAGLIGRGIDARTTHELDTRHSVHSVRIMADGEHAKMYINGTRVSNVPTANLGRSGKILFSVRGSPTQPALVGHIRVAAGGRDLYDALAADGRVVTRGILFDTGSDRIRPESTPTLRAIAGIMEQHPELRLRVEGHTDSVGSADVNQALSELRASAVREYLVEREGIDGARLEAAGIGQTSPVDSNESPEGRQNNRRVELVRL